MLSRKNRYNVCVVGVGAVGKELLRVLRQRQFPVERLTVLARSERPLEVDGQIYLVKAVSEAAFHGMDLVLFAGTEGEKGAAVTFAEAAIQAGAVCIDNGSDFRLKPEVPLVVPEVNPEDLKAHQGLIANPNCSTILMVVALGPVHRKFGVERIVVSTYQAASGAGSKAAEALWEESRAIVQGRTPARPEALPQQIAFNLFPHIGPFEELGYSSEEWKLVKETRKILHDDSIAITATAVRVPVEIAHCESVYLETKRPADLLELKRLWQESPGVTFLEGPEYPMPTDAAGQDEVMIGRLRPDPQVPNAFVCWVVCDNLRKGAALNAVQIAECLIRA